MSLLRACGRVAALSVLALPPGRAVAQTLPEGGAVITLEEAIGLSLEHQPAAVAAAGAVSSARADRLQARGALLPNLTVNGIFANSSNQRFDQASGQLVSQNYTSQLQGSYELFGAGRRFATLRASGAGVDAADARYRAQRFQTVLQTTSLFYAAAGSADLVRVAEQRLARAREQLTFAQVRLELGTATTSDVLRAEIEVGNSELALVDAQTNLRINELELGRQVGKETPVRPAPESLPDGAPDLPPTEALVRRALVTSPAVVAADATLTSRHMEALAAYTPYLPTVRLTGGYDWFAYDFPPRQQSWSLRMTASLPLFNGFSREANVQRARAAQRTAEVQARDAELGARVNVESAVQSIVAAGRRVEISDRTVQLAEEDLRVQEERYQLGVTTILDLQASQVALADAQVAAVTARQALGSAVAGLEAILGESINQESGR
ncbi:MAG TPA: TolC family protein [Longimicrobiales bacterium]|nr:TolC family protein [Longimicrobiales bacterium]